MDQKKKIYAKLLLTRFARKSTTGRNSAIKNDCNFKKGTFPVGDINSALGRSSNRIGNFAILSNVRTAKQSAYYRGYKNLIDPFNRLELSTISQSISTMLNYMKDCVLIIMIKIFILHLALKLDEILTNFIKKGLHMIRRVQYSIIPIHINFR